MYVTYEFYTTSYYGDTVTESLFDKYEQLARREIDYFTLGRLKQETISSNVKMAMCELIDFVYRVGKYNEYSSVDTDNKIIKSVSAGSESITYATTENQYYLSSVNKNEYSQNILFILKKYLDEETDSSGTSLLYMGR